MDVVFPRAAVLAMELAAARAWPPGHIAAFDGWQVRTSGGRGRRANSVLPLAYTGRDLDATIDNVERHYRGRGLKSYFQLSSLAAPDGLDERLAARGYTCEEPTLLLAKPLSAAPMPDAAEVLDEPSPEWMAIFTAPLAGGRAAEVPEILARVPAPRAYFLLRRDDVALATALAVLSPEGIAVVECVATRAERRRSGAAHAVMDALEAWAVAQGATVAALQVTEGNTAARALYTGRGYGAASRYHYRWRQV